MWVLVETLVPNRGVKDVDDHSGGGGSLVRYGIRCHSCYAEQQDVISVVPDAPHDWQTPPIVCQSCGTTVNRVAVYFITGVLLEKKIIIFI